MVTYTKLLCTLLEILRLPLLHKSLSSCLGLQKNKCPQLQEQEAVLFFPL